MHSGKRSFAMATKKAPDRAPFCFSIDARYFAAGLAGGAPAAGVASSFLRCFFGALLQLFLQLLLVFLEYLRIGRRAVIGLGEFAASGSGSVSGAPLELIACTTRFWPFFSWPIISGVAS